MKIQDILDQIGNDVLSEDTKKMLVEAFEDAVQVQTTQRLEAEITSALHKLDEEHHSALKELLEAIDEDHTQKLIKTVETIDEDHARKFMFMKKKFQKALVEDARKFKTQLTEQLSNYLDLYLDEAVPAQSIQEAVQNKQAQRVLNEIKQLVSVDEEFINATVREAVQDGKQQIEALSQELHEAVKNNIRLHQQIKTANAELILERATSNFDPNKKAFVTKTLRGKDPQYITENIDYVVKMFDRDDERDRDLLAEEAKKTAVSAKVDTPKGQKRVIMESADHDEGAAINGYLSSLKRQDGK